jgi:UDP-N-acetylglucosamine 2-epimerase (non-hydrolysing)
MKSFKKLKIITVVGTRPEIIRLSRILNCFDKNFDHILINTNQNYDYTLNKIFFEDLRLKKPKYLLNCSRKNNI